MDFFSLLRRKQRSSASVTQILSQQLLWMLLLRIVLYTLLLGLNFFFQEYSIKVVFMPTNLLIILLLGVYLTTIASAFYLLATQENLRKFAFIQNLLDTLFATVLVYCTGVSLSGFTSVYFFPIIAGGLILPRKGGLVAAAASTLEYGTILMLEFWGHLPLYLIRMGFEGNHDAMLSLNLFSVQGLTFFLAAILSAMFGMRIRTTEAALTDSLRNYDRLAVLYKQIFDNIATGIITVDPSGIITSANNACERITGYPANSLVSKKFDKHFPSFNLSAPRMRQSADFQRFDGKQIRVGYSHVDLKQPDETPPLARKRHKIITLQDIGEIEKLERQMRQAEKMAAIGMMSAGIAHDFRNPLTAISGSAQMLAAEFSQKGSENLANYELAEIIRRESERMIVTVSDFLKFSRPETANREWFSLKSCLDEVFQVCRANPNWPSSACLQILFDEGIDIWADQKQMFTLFNHLIHNSMAFCPPGEEIIEFDVREIRSADGSDTLQISVSDNGPGVNDADREKIFEPFYTTRADGTGLGLAIALQIADEHTGTITVTRGKYGGACFNVSLPLPS